MVILRDKFRRFCPRWMRFRRGFEYSEFVIGAAVDHGALIQ